MFDVADSSLHRCLDYPSPPPVRREINKKENYHEKDNPHTQDVGAPKYPPSHPAQVQILRTEPTRTHVRLGEVRAEPSSESVDVSRIKEALRQEAAKLGADAVVVVYDRTQVTGAFVTGPWWGRSLQPIEGRVVIGVAIKYQ